jgi:hypothetical protein
MQFFVKSPFGRDKKKHIKCRLYGQPCPKTNRFTVKDYFEKLKELATNAIRYHGQA